MGKKRLKLYDQKSWLYREYVIKKKTAAEIAKLCGVSKMTISRKLTKYGLQKADRNYRRG